MKSVIIRDINGRILYHFKRNKTGVIAKVATDLAHCSSSKIILNDGSQIKFPQTKTFRDLKGTVKP
jgi:hypothetical protein